MSEPSNPLELLSKAELLAHIEHLQEEVRMSRAFSNISEAGINDATL